MKTIITCNTCDFASNKNELECIFSLISLQENGGHWDDIEQMICKSDICRTETIVDVFRADTRNSLIAALAGQHCQQQIQQQHIQQQQQQQIQQLPQKYKKRKRKKEPTIKQSQQTTIPNPI